ncbi:AAA family ATPase, partial [Nonomuraea sp. NPDC059022]
MSRPFRLLRQQPEPTGDEPSPGAELAVPGSREVAEQAPEVEEPTVYDVEVMPPHNTPAGVVARFIPSPAPRKAAATALSVGATIGRGLRSWWIRAWEGLSLGVYREQIRVARALGDREALRAAQDHKREASKDRRELLMALPRMMLGLVKVTVGVVLGVPTLMVLLSTAIWWSGAGSFGALWTWAADVLRFVFTTIAFLWTPAVISAPILILWAAYREGDRCAEALPAWTMSDAPGDAHRKDVIPDEGSILNALRHLDISALNRAFKAGWRPRFILPTQRDGQGYRTQLELPYAVTVEMILGKKTVLAHNLSRFPVEVWPTEPRDHPGVMDLWVADKGALTGPVPEWPLLKKGAGDYFRGVPVAVEIRGKSIIGRLFEANYVIAGMMGSGKSTLIITLLLGALLDPLVTADVYVMAVNADYDPMRPRLRTLMTGTGDDVAAACLASIRDAYDDLDRRGQALKEHGARAVTRELAEKDARLRPRIIVIDECQALFLHEEYGNTAIELAVKLENAARKYAVTIIFATPEPSSDSLPRKLIAITSNKACFAIGDQTSNDAALGTGSYKAGISAVG